MTSTAQIAGPDTYIRDITYMRLSCAWQILGKAYKPCEVVMRAIVCVIDFWVGDVYRMTAPLLTQDFWQWILFLHTIWIEPGFIEECSRKRESQVRRRLSVSRTVVETNLRFPQSASLEFSLTNGIPGILRIWGLMPLDRSAQYSGKVLVFEFGFAAPWTARVCAAKFGHHTNTGSIFPVLMAESPQFFVELSMSIVPTSSVWFWSSVKGRIS